jgi:hypothetical protein
MDDEFLIDLFLEESNFVDPDNHSCPAAKVYDSFGLNHTQYPITTMTVRQLDTTIRSIVH